MAAFLVLCAVFYLLIGAALTPLCAGSNLVGRVVTIFLWPYLLLVDGTPRIRWLTHLSGQEVVIEETTDDQMRVIQTVRQWGGHEYTRVKGQ